MFRSDVPDCGGCLPLIFSRILWKIFFLSTMCDIVVQNSRIIVKVHDMHHFLLGRTKRFVCLMCFSEVM